MRDESGILNRLELVLETLLRAKTRMEALEPTSLEAQVAIKAYHHLYGIHEALNWVVYKEYGMQIFDGFVEPS